MSATTKWSFEADYLQACNCDFGCPCEFSAPPTRGDCQGVGAWSITRGQYGNLPLDGIGVGFAAHWPKAIHLGNGTICIFIDQKATPQQRQALITIMSGQAGGIPFEILAATFSKVLEPQFLPFHFNWDGLNSSVKVGNAMVCAVTPILNPVTKKPESVKIEHGTGFIFQNAEALASREMKVNAGELKFNWPDKAGFISKIKYGN